MLRKMSLIVSVIVLGLLVVLPVSAGAPNFGAGLWADGKQWGTKVTTPLPEAKDNLHSFDAFYFITHEDSKAWVMTPVMEAGPGNSDYNGGRWYTVRVTILEEHEDDVPDQFMSLAQIEAARDAGYVIIGDEPENDGVHPWIFFQCPLLPLK
jgi:hypothetical protein